MKHKKTLPLYLSLALSWFGYHCGAGFSSGKQIWLYSAQYGLKGIITPFIAWITCGVFMYGCLGGSYLY